MDSVARYKRMGDLLVVAPPRKTGGEVSARELSRDTSEVLARVGAGGRAVITKHGRPIAVLMEVDEAVGLCGTALLRKRDAERRLFGDELAAELRQRDLRRAPRLLGGD
jgi:prevent-host-death family protein